jgi:hypothetical protein
MLTNAYYAKQDIITTISTAFSVTQLFWGAINAPVIKVALHAGQDIT